MLPRFAPALVVNGTIKATQLCPQSHLCPGGQASRAFDPSQPTNLDGTSMSRCAEGTWTAELGASYAAECLTLPGFRTFNGKTEPCRDGEYRAGWRPASLASRCDACGANISSSGVDQVSQYNISTGVAVSLDVRASAASCYLQPGQGMYYSAVTNSYTAVNCDSNFYGVGSITAGLAANPCKACPSGMHTSLDLSASAAYWASDGAGKQGFTSPLACVTRAGHGYNGVSAARCPVGSMLPATTSPAAGALWA